MKKRIKVQRRGSDNEDGTEDRTAQGTTVMLFKTDRTQGATVQLSLGGRANSMCNACCLEGSRRESSKDNSTYNNWIRDHRSILNSCY